MTVIFDTGSDWLIIDSDLCSNCIDPVFHTSLSTTFNLPDNEKIISLVYGSANATGFNATD